MKNKVRVLARRKTMKAKALLIVAAAMLMAMPVAASDVATISVTGSATVDLEPDTASFTITAAFTEATTKEAREKTAVMIGNAVSILTSQFGVAEDDLETTYISASTEYSWIDDERVLTGQRATQSLNVKFRNLDAIGDVYTELMELDGITLSDVSLDKEDKSEGYSEARIKAVQDAYRKASDFAEAAGVKVGKVLSISDNSSYSAPLYRSANLMLASADVAAESTPITFYSSDISVSATVSIVYAIE